jgi:hypothetical protein
VVIGVVSRVITLLSKAIKVARAESKPQLFYTLEEHCEIGTGAL